MAQQESFKFKLVSPERVLVEGDETAVLIPAMKGPTMIQPGYAPMIYMLEPGLLRVVTGKKGETDDYFVGGGFVEVDNHNCTVLAHDTVAINDLNAQDLNQMLDNLEEDYAQETHDDEIKVSIAEEISYTKAMLYALEQRKADVIL
jgi:F-type H+-transporting ATPase subunit epsilon